MAKYDVTFSCGHTETIQLFGKETDRQRKIKWYEEHCVCSSCYKKQQEEARKAAAEKAAAEASKLGLPELIGTPKQIAWAEEIRCDIVKSINNCNHNGESTEFVEFMLRTIDEVLDEAIRTSSVPITETGININKLLNVMEYNVPITANEIMDKLGIKSKETLRSTYLDPAIKEGVIALTIPDKPTSKNQMYYKV